MFSVAFFFAVYVNELSQLSSGPSDMHVNDDTSDENDEFSVQLKKGKVIVREFVQI